MFCRINNNEDVLSSALGTLSPGFGVDTGEGIEMGSEAKSRKRRSSPSASPSEDEQKRSRKHRKRDDKERKSRKDGSKEKRKKSEKSHKHSKSREGKEVKGEAQTQQEGCGFKLTKDDYYSKNNEFSTWLKEERGIYFSELSSEAARDLFSSFVKDWNNRKLHSRYYEGISSGPRTAHNWKIKHDK
uniref:Style cell-cycle inhibitor 1-A isoform X3 n=1 Tax=Elaeis guineensis var. tenera TaxID=51953 RepID=A0A6I9SCW2_ELAGV|nr:style cell-cycle inhibitor 1-A isoform X3 [Elaeis guineensis]